MKETVWMILAGVSIALFLYSMTILGTALEDIEDTTIRWKQTETEEYGGLVW